MNEIEDIMAYNLNVEWEAVQSIVLTVLKEDLESLRRDWIQVYNSDGGYVFSHDKREDLEQISEHISAYKKLIRYYGGSV